MPRKEGSWSYSKATVRVIREQYAIIKKKNGAVTPRNIVDHARDPENPLHRFFDWDNSVAGEKWRLEQAGGLLRRVQVYVTKDGVKQPMRVFVSTVKNDVRQYEETTEVLSNPVSARTFLDDMKRDLDGVVRRYEMYSFCKKSLKLVRAAIAALDAEMSVESERKGRKKKAA
jgi:hypothetical protein